MPILIDEILDRRRENQHTLNLGNQEELDEYELWDLTPGELLNNPAIEILRQETGFLRRLAEWDRTSYSDEVAEPEYEFVCQLIRQYPELLETQSDAQKDRFMLV
ncbi:MAG: hypothetical protein ACO4CS_18655 [bacterium]|jgi:hypothetical protein